MEELLVTNEGNLDFLLGYSGIKLGYAHASHGTGRERETLERYLSSLEVIERLALKFPDNLIILRYTTIIYNNLGGCLREMGNIDEAKAYYRQSEKIREDLFMQDREYAPYCRDLWLILNYEGDLIWSTNEPDKLGQIEDYYTRAAEMIEHILGWDYKNAELLRDRSMSDYRLGNIYSQLALLGAGNRLEYVRRAEVHYERGMTTLGELMEVDPMNHEYRSTFAFICFKRAQLYQESGIEGAQKLVSRFEEYAGDLQQFMSYKGERLREAASAMEHHLFIREDLRFHYSRIIDPQNIYFPCLHNHLQRK